MSIWTGPRSALLVVALVGCAARHETSPVPPPNADPLEGEVFAAVIHDVIREPGAMILLLPERNVHLLRRDYSDRYKASWDIPEDSLSPSEREAVSDFERRNPDSTWTGLPLRLETPYRWITMKEFKRSGDRIVSLSRVGFSRDHREALVDVGYHCGGLCGEGNFVFLHRGDDSVWHITHRYRIWVA